MTEAMHQVLIVEDDSGIREVLRVLLTAERYRVIEAENAHRAAIEARSHKPDLLIVDLGLPDRNGLEVIRTVRSWSPVPIIVLSARSNEADKIAALDEGADDYVTKPFAARELLARVRAALRRSATGAGKAAHVTLGEITVDLAKREALGSGTRRASHAARISRARKSCAQRGLDREPGSTDSRGVGTLASRRHSGTSRLHPQSAPEAGTRSQTTQISRDRSWCGLSTAYD